jgi:cytochrome c oxidase subunit 1
MFFQLLFIFFFVSGGISGMAVAHTGMDILFHDSFYVVGHFHVMLAGSAMFAAFGAFYFYFPAVFGVKFSRIYGYLHCLFNRSTYDRGTNVLTWIRRYASTCA